MGMENHGPRKTASTKGKTISSLAICSSMVAQLRDKFVYHCSSEEPVVNMQICMLHTLNSLFMYDMQNFET